MTKFLNAAACSGYPLSIPFHFFALYRRQPFKAKSGLKITPPIDFISVLIPKVEKFLFKKWPEKLKP